MAALTRAADSGAAITLTTPAASRLRNLASVPFWLVILAVLYASGAASDAGFLFLVGLFAVYQVLSGLASILMDTRIRIDPTARTVTRTQRLLGLPLSTVTVDFGQISRLEVTQTRASVRSDQARPPSFQLQAIPKQGRPLVINWDGTRDEMVQLARRVAEVSHVPFQDEMAPGAEPEVAPTYAPENAPWPPIRSGPLRDERPAFESVRRGRVAEPALGSSLTVPPSTTAGPAPAPSTLAMPMSFQAPLSGDSTFLAPVMSGREFQRPVMTGGEFLRPVMTGGEFLRPVMGEYQATVSAISPASSAPLSGSGAVSYSESVFGLPLPAGAGGPPPRNEPASIVSFSEEPAPAAMPSRPARDWRRTNLGQLQELVREDASDVGSWAELARRNMEARRWARARDAYLEWFKNDPLNGGIQNDLGITFVMLGQGRDAETAFNRAIALDPFGVRQRLNLSLLYLRTGRGERGLAILHEAEQYAYDDSTRRAIEAVRRGTTPSWFRSAG